MSKEKSLLDKAKAGDKNSITTMFTQFIDKDETIKYVEYLGKKGVLGVESESFICLTDKRVANFEYGPFKKLNYEEIAYEKVLYSAVKQPSKIFLLFYILFLPFVFLLFMLFVEAELILIPLEILDDMELPIDWLYNIIDSYWFFDVFFPVFLGLVLLVYSYAFANFLYYRFFKSGFLFVNRPGCAVYVYFDRKKTVEAYRIYRYFKELKENRIKELGYYISTTH